MTRALHPNTGDSGPPTRQNAGSEEHRVRILPSWARLGLCTRDAHTARRDRQVQVEIGFCLSQIVLSVLTVAQRPSHRRRNFLGLTLVAQRAGAGVGSRV
ncbi:hypothetical protein [Actinoplanes sp. NPDC051411]|uniref:hypothetical protein n=1 Tax=Actinoplanes sp. NPDC051411 TaxID=3155522 RepID=UPI0034477E3C